MDNKLKAVNKVLSVIVVILAFVMLFTTPVMLDDWWFGANTKDMLKFVFTAYDGRYIPNVLVVVLLWAPVIVRAAVELIILIGLAYFIFRTLKGNGYLLSLFAVLFLFVPGSIFVQTFTWVTGYTLYIVSALTVMFLYDLFINQVLEDKPISVKKMCILCPLVLLSQLVLETTTLYAFFLMIATLVIYYVRYKKISRQTLIFLLFAAAGAVLMFHNGAYSSAVGERNIAEKTIYLGPSMTENIRIWWIIFKSIVAVLWFGSSSLSALAAIILVPYSYFMSRRFRIVNVIISVFFACVFTYTIMYTPWDYQGVKADIYGVLCILFVVFILYLIINSNLAVHEKQSTFICAFSQFVLAGPFVMVNPIADRCFLQPFIHLTVLVCIMAGQMLKSEGFKKETSRIRKSLTLPRAGLIARIALTGFLCLSLYNISIVNKTYEYRDEAIREGLESGAEVIYIPCIPYNSNYVFAANLDNDDERWIGEFKTYYGIPEDVEVVFTDPVV